MDRWAYIRGMIWLYIFAIAGPNRAKIKMITTATKTKIIAYSIRPLPRSLGANLIFSTSFLKNSSNAYPSNPTRNGYLYYDSCDLKIQPLIRDIALL